MTLPTHAGGELMACANCGQENPADNSYCGKCGARVGATLEDTIADRNKTRAVIEVEIFQAVTNRLGTLAKWLAIPSAILIAGFGWVIGKGEWDLHTVVRSATIELNGSVHDAQTNIRQSVESTTGTLGQLKRQSADLYHQYEGLQSNLNRYTAVNKRIEQLQTQLSTIQGQIKNWYKTMETEIFNSPGSNVRFSPWSAQPDFPPSYKVELTLKKVPIPESLRIVRHALTVAPNVITVDGRQVSFRTYIDQFPTVDDAIVVQYHPLQ